MSFKLGPLKILLALTAFDNHVWTFLAKMLHHIIDGIEFFLTIRALKWDFRTFFQMSEECFPMILRKVFVDLFLLICLWILNVLVFNVLRASMPNFNSRIVNLRDYLFVS